MNKPSRIICKATGPFIPSYSHPGDAGADLKSSGSSIVPARGKALVSTGLSIALPEGYVALIWPRSGLAVQNSIDCGAGVVDATYRGEIKVLLFNHSDENFNIEPGDRIAQLLVQKVENINFLPVDSLDKTERNEGGFGSTGK
ncbi:MAG: dUTP diphosphatase [Nitrospina sp.]|nr:dUTP diphosphatase [Nitrospina sp.]MBT6600758.1 dUTP diphosphatase [Nitrospina sp.]